MTRIHIVTGDKGNVGKSAWCAAMIEYYRYYESPLELIDADSDSQTLSRTYKDAFPVMLSDNSAYTTFVDTIYEIAYEEAQKKDKGGDVLVDLPAGGEKFINKWLDECAITERAKEDGITIFKWWVSDSDAVSIQLFEEDFDKYPSISHVFLKNMGRSAAPQWVNFDKKKKLHASIKKGQIALIEIPSVNSIYLDEIREAGVPLADVLADKKYELFSLSKNMRIKAWVGHTQALIHPILSLDKVKAKGTADKIEAGAAI
jgi:hypothetical protein